MIKSIHKLYVLPNEKRFDALVEFFDALGLTRAEAWTGKRSRGAKLHASGGGVEIGLGEGFPDADVVIEVDSADVLYDLARLRGFNILSGVAAQDWGARMFTIELPGRAGRVAVFSYEQQPAPNETTA